MNPARVGLAGLLPADWQIVRAPFRFAAYVIAAQFAVAAAVTSMLVVQAGSSGWTTFGLLLVLAIVFEEASRRTAFLQLRLNAELKGDMTSVWGVAAAIALRPGQASLLVVLLLGFVWFRQQRPAGEILHRKAFNAAAAAIATAAASFTAHSIAGAHPSAAGTGMVTLAVVAAILADALVTRALVTFGLVLLGVRGPVLFGTVDNNLLEVATLCLGGLVGVTAVHEPVLCLLAVVPMTALQRGALVRELETAATVDSKTGLLNATAWEVMARRELSRAERNRADTSVLVIDVDRFKAVNDRFGHLAGDAVLRAIARALSDEVREYDSVGRFGGEEFVAVLPSTDEIEALAIADRVRARINEFHVRTLAERAIGSYEAVDEGDDTVSVSIGVASSATDGNDLPELLLAADSALYRAKADGRNRVALARRDSDAPPPPVPAADPPLPSSAPAPEVPTAGQASVERARS